MVSVKFSLKSNLEIWIFTYDQSLHFTKKNPIFTYDAIFVWLPIFDFSRAIFKEHSCQCYKMSRRLGYKARQNENNESSLETNDSPKPVIFNEYDTEKMYHWNIFMEF